LSPQIVIFLVLVLYQLGQPFDFLRKDYNLLFEAFLGNLKVVVPMLVLLKLLRQLLTDLAQPIIIQIQIL
jgi:hypothetical protein